MALDPATGIASGTPTAVGNYSCLVEITITHNGVSWTNLEQMYLVID